MEVIQKEKLIIDVKYIEVIEAAENHACTAWLELQQGFMHGIQGLPKNYKMARYYTDKMIDGCINDPVYSQSPRMLFDSYRASFEVELMYGNFSQAQTDLKKTINTLTKKIPVQEWDLSFFKRISENNWLI